MKTPEKKSLMALREKHQVDRYLDEIMRESLVARVIINREITLDHCRLVSISSNKDLVLDTVLVPGEYPEMGHADVTFAGDFSLYKFSVPMLSIDITGSRRMTLTLKFPDTITKRERRKHIRVKPHTVHPVAVRVLVSNSETIDAEPVDISEGGISFMLTEYVTHFKSGDPVDLVISIPRVKNLSAGAVIKSVIHLMDLTRIGAEFQVLSEESAKTIIEYVELCEQQVTQDAYDEE